MMILISAFMQEANQSELDSSRRKRRHTTGFVRVSDASPSWLPVDFLSHLLHRRLRHIRQCRLLLRRRRARFKKHRYATSLLRHSREFLQRFHRTRISAQHCLMFFHSFSGYVVRYTDITALGDGEEKREAAKQELDKRQGNNRIIQSATVQSRRRMHVENAPVIGS